MSVSVRLEKSFGDKSSCLSLADSRAAPDESHIASVTADQPQAKSHQVHRELCYEWWGAALPCLFWGPEKTQLEHKEFRMDLYKFIKSKNFEKVKSPSGNIKEGSS